MKFIIILAVIVLAGVILVSCKTKKNTLTTSLNTPVITLSKSSCRGNCKQYNLSINEDKTMQYKGIRNVDNIGAFEAKISNEDYNVLLDLFKKNNFSDLDNQYLSGAKDLQSIAVSYKSHSVEFHKRKASDDLKGIVEQLDALIGKVDWKKIK